MLTNADTPADAKKARELGAEGIGLCRTEHMFFEGNRIDAFREMICSETVEEREAALAKILPEQQGDFEKLYEALEGNPVTIRFLDPPLHEFVPTEEEDIKKLADAQGILTVRGGMTSHAAVVARGMGTCCVSGCGDITMDEENKKFTLAGKEYHEGDFISLDGSTGNIYDGVIATVDATIAGEFGSIMG